METSVPEQLLVQYYSELFPREYVHNWLDPRNLKTNKNIPIYREVAKVHQDERFQRHLNLDKLQDWNRIISLAPREIHIGALHYYSLGSLVGNMNPAVMREFILDIDINDYSDLRFCSCIGSDLCKACWGFLVFAVKIVSHIITRSLGTSEFQWFFSGRRGVHCWIKSPDIVRFSSRNRVYLANFFSKPAKYEGYVYGTLLDEIRPFLLGYLSKNDIFSIEKSRKILANGLGVWIPYNGNSLQFYMDFKKHLTSNYDQVQAKKLERKAIYNLLWPRIDYNVSSSVQHLIRCPFSVHPKTGNLVFPFSVSECVKVLDEIEKFNIYNLQLDNILERASLLALPQDSDEPQSN